MERRLCIRICKTDDSMNEKSSKRIISCVHFFENGFTVNGGIFTSKLIHFFEDHKEEDYPNEELYVIRALESLECGFQTEPFDATGGMYCFPPSKMADFQNAKDPQAFIESHSNLRINCLDLRDPDDIDLICKEIYNKKDHVPNGTHIPTNYEFIKERYPNEEFIHFSKQGGLKKGHIFVRGNYPYLPKYCTVLIDIDIANRTVDFGACTIFNKYDFLDFYSCYGYEEDDIDNATFPTFDFDPHCLKFDEVIEFVKTLMRNTDIKVVKYPNKIVSLLDYDM